MIAAKSGRAVIAGGIYASDEIKTHSIFAKSLVQ
jgi:hypothetical protein